MNQKYLDVVISFSEKQICYVREDLAYRDTALWMLDGVRDLISPLEGQPYIAASLARVDAAMALIRRL